MTKDKIVTVSGDNKLITESYYEKLFKNKSTEDLLREKQNKQNSINSNQSAYGQMRIFNFLNQKFPKFDGNETRSQIGEKLRKSGVTVGQMRMRGFLGEIKAIDKILLDRNVKIEPTRYKIPSVKGAGGGFSGPIINLDIGPQILKVDDYYLNNSPGSLIDKPLYDD